MLNVLKQGTSKIVVVAWELVSRTLAALADAHDEHMLVVRLADADKVDKCELQQELFRHLIISKCRQHGVVRGAK